MTKTKIKILSLCLLIGACASASAATVGGLVTLSMEWSGESYGNDARASGFITIDTNRFANPGQNHTPGGPGTFVPELSLNIFGASAGNGTFVLSDFTLVSFWTGALPLDFCRELVGQPTGLGPWGTPNGRSLRFAFASNSTSSPGTPRSTDHFELTTDMGAGDPMRLTSLRPIPEPSQAVLISVAAATMILRRSRHLLLRQGPARRTTEKLS